MLFLVVVILIVGVLIIIIVVVGSGLGATQGRLGSGLALRGPGRMKILFRSPGSTDYLWE